MQARKLTAQLRGQYQSAIATKIKALVSRGSGASKQVEQTAQQIERSAFDKISSYKEISLYHQSIADQVFELRYKSEQHHQEQNNNEMNGCASRTCGKEHDDADEVEDVDEGGLYQPVPPFVNPLENPVDNKMWRVAGEQKQADAVQTTTGMKPSNKRGKLSKEKVATIIAVKVQNVKDLVTCANCGPRGKVRYNTKQTRGADEQQTLFCHCETCTNKWKVSR